MTGIHLSARIPKSESPSAAASANSQTSSLSAGARALALAHFIEDALEAGSFASAAEVADYLGVTRARVSQVMGLLGLSARLQEELLMGDLAMSSRGLRRCLGSSSWAVQEAAVSAGQELAYP